MILIKFRSQTLSLIVYVFSELAMSKEDESYAGIAIVLSIFSCSKVGLRMRDCRHERVRMKT